jgi:2-hydroxy-4-carboxymuconate semialdehyde hemiacetal dehydrogenase
MRIGVIGYGAVAAVHVKGLHGWGADLHTIFGPEPERARAFADAHHVPNSTAALDELLDQCDAAIIASPSGRHFEQAQAALRAGRHCLVELPACFSAAEARTLGALASAAERTLQCAHTTRFLSGILRLENWVKSGLLGDIRHVISMRAIPPRRRSWIDDAILHHAAHHIDLLLHWFGDVTPVASVAHPRIEGAQDAALVARLPNGAPVNLSVSYTSRLQETRLTVVGSDHTVTTDGFGFTQSEAAEFAWESDPQECYERAIQVQDRAFIEACSGGPGGVPWQETLRLAECLDLFRCNGGGSL